MLDLEFLTNKQVHGKQLDWRWSQAVFTCWIEFCSLDQFQYHTKLCNSSTEHLNFASSARHHGVFRIFVIFFCWDFFTEFLKAIRHQNLLCMKFKWWKKSATIHTWHTDGQTDYTWTAMFNLPNTAWHKNMTKLNLLQNYTISTLHIASGVQSKLRNTYTPQLSV